MPLVSQDKQLNYLNDLLHVLTQRVSLVSLSSLDGWLDHLNALCMF